MLLCVLCLYVHIYPSTCIVRWECGALRVACSVLRATLCVRLLGGGGAVWSAAGASCSLRARCLSSLHPCPPRDLQGGCECVSSDGAYKVFSPCQAHGTDTTAHTPRHTHGPFHRLIRTDSASTAGPHLHLHYLLSLVDGARS